MLDVEASFLSSPFNFSPIQFLSSRIVGQSPPKHTEERVALSDSYLMEDSLATNHYLLNPTPAG